MVFSVKGHKLLENDQPVKFHATPNMGGSVRPLYLIMHYTAGTTASGAISHMATAGAKASAHLVIDRNGAVTQMVPFNRVAWHAGISKWNGLEGLNQHSIGIEIVNAGKLEKTEGGDWINWAGNEIPPSEVIVATHEHQTSPAGWHVYPKAQLDIVIEVGVALNEAYDFLDVIGHDDVSRGRKIDPGPAFPKISVQSRIIGRQS